MFIRIIRSSVPSLDRFWPVEPKEYEQLLQEYKEQGKLLDRTKKRISETEVELTWIFDSKESWIQWSLEPVQVARRAVIKDYTSSFVVISEDEI